MVIMQTAETATAMATSLAVPIRRALARRPVPGPAARCDTPRPSIYLVGHPGQR
jgi:hypothetical protein